MNSEIVHYYKILEIEQGASQLEIKRAYRDLSMVWHPDRFSNPRLQQKAEARLKQINAAYEFLKLYQPQTAQQKVEPVKPETENRKIIQLCTWEDIASKMAIVLVYLIYLAIAWAVAVMFTGFFICVGLGSISVPLAILSTVIAFVFARRGSNKARD